MNVMDSNKINNLLKLFDINSKQISKINSKQISKVNSKDYIIKGDESLLNKINTVKQEYINLRSQIDNIEKKINNIKN